MTNSTKTPARKKPFRPSKQMKAVLVEKLKEAKSEFVEQYGNDDNPYFDAKLIAAEYDTAIAYYSA